MRHCAECGTEYEETLDRCPECSAPEEVFRCSRCGEHFSDSSSCPSCGMLVYPAPCAEHPDRTALVACVVCGRTLCEVCLRTDHRVYRCERHRDVRVIQGWAQVYSATRDIDAWLIRQRLLAAEIDAQVFSQRDSAFSVDLGELSVVRVLVPAWDYERAREAIESQEDQREEPALVCPSCGEVNEIGSGACRACGSALERPGDD